ncbi:MAG: Gfo/Idh/MocA family oxidoreductase [Pseudolabrys sp.]|nr:Gfo/Idh/MocA family oxidoreductase [Pseudolabrys sp.]MSP32879.1 Gfo/Idh/MocA family oxidoreductase [Pseudolabrys sp.]
MLNTAIVGLGWWGKTLVKAAKDFGAPINFVRGVTLEPDTVRDFAAEHKLAIGTSFEEAIADPQVQAVILATPHSKHRAQAEAAAAAKKHIYCEKPFALAKADAVAMLEACKRAGIEIGVGHHFRLMPSMRVLDELAKSGAFGTIMHVEGNYSHDWLANMPADSWRMAAAESRAGGMTGMGIHVLDCFRDLVGPMRRIAALSKARALKVPAGDTTSALIEFESGATGTLATTIKTPFDWRIAVYGENCRAESVSETRAVIHRPGKAPEVIDHPADNHLGRNLDYFAKAAMGQGAFPISPEGILQTASALEAVFKSVDADGAWMTV